MFCYNCGCNLSEHDFCTACGADVSLYKKIMHVSNMYYNEGLEKAGVRDLSGAINSLRQSLKFNKNNVEARNLLGLVYFEMGEAVAALSEWVISKNLRPEKNIADDYIDMIQSNASRLDTMNQTIKKYNQAYTYCVQGSKDLAVIQLKKVLSMNPRLIQAHQLLALLYIDSEQWERAKRELKKCLDIDRNNTMALRYMKEVDLVLSPDASGKTTEKHKNDDFVRYQSDNEIIIQPVNMKERKRSSIATLLNIALGIAIGFCAMFFLVMPGRIAEEKNAASVKIAEIGNQLDAKTSTITELENQLKRLETEKNELDKQVKDYAGVDVTLEQMENLVTVVSAYLVSGDKLQAAKDLEKIAGDIDVVDQASEAFKGLYNGLFGMIGPEVSKEYFNEGKALYGSGKYAEAIEAYKKAVYYDPSYTEALYQLGHSYRKNGNNAQALSTYKKVQELFPESQRAKDSQSYINNLS